MTHGPEYKTNGKRPVWLKDGDECEPCWFAEGGWYGHYTLAEHVRDWPNVIAIRLPADHWANRSIEAGFEPWAGGDKAPKDWDGGDILVDWGDGDFEVLKNEKLLIWGRDPNGTGYSHGEIIGYKKEEIDVSEEVQDEYIEAARLFSYEGTDWPEGMGAWDTVEYVKKNSKEPFSRAVMELARMIQTYEPHRKPKDRDEEIAEKWAKRLSCGSRIATETILSAIKEAKNNG